VRPDEHIDPAADQGPFTRTPGSGPHQPNDVTEGSVGRVTSLPDEAVEAAARLIGPLYRGSLYVGWNSQEQGFGIYSDDEDGAWLTPPGEYAKEPREVDVLGYVARAVLEAVAAGGWLVPADRLLRTQAADDKIIESLVAERDRLRLALERIVGMADEDAYAFANKAYEVARAALEGDTD